MALLFLSAGLGPAAAAVAARQGFSPYGMALTRDGRFAYLSFDLSPFIFKIRLADMTVVASAEFSRYFPAQCSTIALDESESRVFLQDHTQGRLLVFDAATLDEIRVLDGFSGYGKLTRSRWGNKMILDSGRVWLIDPETLAVTALSTPRPLSLIRESATDPNLWYALSSPPGGTTEAGIYNVKTGQWSGKAVLPRVRAGDAHDFLVLPDGSKAYVATFTGWSVGGVGSGSWIAIDLATGAVRETPVAGGALCMRASADGRRVVVGAGWPAKPDARLLHAVDTRTDTEETAIEIPTQKFGWRSTQVNNLQFDPTDERWLYATTSDGNDLVKVDMKSGAVDTILVLNDERNQPSSFVRQPGSARGYVLLTWSNEALEVDLDSGEVTRAVQFPSSRTDVRTFGIAFRDANTILMSQGSYMQELAADLTLRKRYNFPAGTPSIWGIIGSRDGKSVYSVAQMPGTSTPNMLVAIDAASVQISKTITMDGGSFNLPWEHPDAGKLYVLGGMSNGAVVVHVVDAASLTVRKSIRFDDPAAPGISAGPYYPYAYDAGSRTLFVGASEVILAIDTDRDEIRQVIPLTEVAQAIGLAKSSSLTYVNVVGLAFHPGQNRLYAAHLDGSFFSVYDVKAKRFVPQLMSARGYMPARLVANDSASKVLSLNRRSDDLTLIDTGTGAVERLIDIHACNPSPARFGLTAGGPAGGRVWVSALQTTGPCSVSTSAGWLTAVAEGVGPQSLQVAADAAVFGPGSYRGAVTLRSATLAEASVEVNLKAGSGVSSTHVDGVTDSAGFGAVIAPAGWASVFGSNLAPATRTWRGDEIVEGALPTRVEGVGVRVNGREASISLVSPGQLNVQVPAGLADGRVEIQVTNNGSPSNTVSVSLQQQAPQLYRYLPSSYAAAFHTDYHIAAKPELFPGCADAARCPAWEAAPGETIVLYGTGFGATAPATPAGTVISAPVSVAGAVQVRFGMATASASAWLVSAGLYQVNVRVPDTLPDGDVPLTVSVAGTVSTAQTLLTIKRARAAR